MRNLPKCKRKQHKTRGETTARGERGQKEEEEEQAEQPELE